MTDRQGQFWSTAAIEDKLNRRKQRRQSHAQKPIGSSTTDRTDDTDAYLTDRQMGRFAASPHSSVIIRDHP
jgi:hypothetical protein